MKQKFTGVILFEDNAAFREDLTSIFSSHDRFLMLGAFDNSANAAEHVRECDPDVVIMDIEMPQADGIAGVKAIRAAGFRVPVVMLTAFDDSHHVFEAICAGASGYLTKSATPDKIFSAIDEVLQGGAPMSPAIAAKTLQLLSAQSSRTTIDYRLTDKELVTLKLLVDGNSYKMIATEVGVGRETIKTHIRNIYEKLQVHSSTEAVSKALRERIV